MKDKSDSLILLTYLPEKCFNDIRYFVTADGDISFEVLEF